MRSNTCRCDESNRVSLQNLHITRLRDYAIAQLRDCAITRLRNYAITQLRDTQLRDYAIAQLRDCAITRLHAPRSDHQNSGLFLVESTAWPPVIHPSDAQQQQAALQYFC